MGRILLFAVIGVFALGTVGLACGGTSEEDAAPVGAEATMPEDEGGGTEAGSGDGDGDDTTGDDGTGGGADTHLTDTGDGDDTTGDDGTGGGDNTQNDDDDT